MKMNTQRPNAWAQAGQWYGRQSFKGILPALVLLILITAVGSQGQFFRWNNITNLLRQAAPVGIMASAGVFVIVGGNIDLSVGSTLSLTALISCNLVGTSTALALIVPIIVGVLCGGFNGLLVGVLRFNPFISTLGTMTLFQAFAYFYSDNKFLSAAENETYRLMGQGSWGTIPIPFFILLLVCALFMVLLSKTSFGRNVYIQGGNAECAKYSGISYAWTTTLTYALAGAAAALGGAILVSRGMAAQPEMGLGREFELITGMVVGGVALSGGRGSVLSGVLGVLFVVVLNNAFIMLEIPLYYQYSVMGLIILLAVGLDVLSERRNTRGKKA